MRFVRLAFVGSIALGVFAAVSAAGCHTATQITLELSTTATCSDLHGTAITVGVSPKDTEDRVGIGYVSAKTSDCTDLDKQIGTLVITPSDEMRGAVVVVVAYSSPTIPIHDPADCKPPLYENCIVARRSFSFVEHTKLRMPITIEPDCLNVPCDAVTTCHKGKCFDSTVAPTDGDETTQPGEKPNDGGFDEASVVDVVTPPPPNDGGIDAPPDGPPDGGPPPPASCAPDGLRCGSAMCVGASCCPPPPGTFPSCQSTCGGSQALCCRDVDCPAGTHCPQQTSSGLPVSCVNNTVTGSGPVCDAGLRCPTAGGGLVLCDHTLNSGCCSAPPAPDPYCHPMPVSCSGSARFCCDNQDCDGGMCTLITAVSNPTPAGGTIGTCQ